MDAGDTLHIDEPGTTLDSHLWITVSDPDADPDRIVLVNLTTYRSDKDQACILDRGDHPFIRHKTCVEYRRAKVVSHVEIEALLRLPQVSRREPVTPDLLKRIRDGVADSRMQWRIVKILADQGLIEL